MYKLWFMDYAHMGCGVGIRTSEERILVRSAPHPIAIGPRQAASPSDAGHSTSRCPWGAANSCGQMCCTPDRRSDQTGYLRSHTGTEHPLRVRVAALLANHCQQYKKEVVNALALRIEEVEQLSEHQVTLVACPGAKAVIRASCVTGQSRIQQGSPRECDDTTQSNASTAD